MNIVARGANKEDRARGYRNIGACRVIYLVRRRTIPRRLGARVDDRVVRAVNAAVTLVGRNSNSFSTFLVSRLDDGDFAELDRWPAVRPDLVAS